MLPSHRSFPRLDSSGETEPAKGPRDSSSSIGGKPLTLVHRGYHERLVHDFGSCERHGPCEVAIML